MKTTVLFSAMILCFIFLQNTNAQTNATFKVYGNCDMCKTRIEKAVNKQDGVKSVDWNKDTKMLTVSYDSSMISIETIHQKIAAVGHDTEKVRAEDKKYNNLHECCKYERNADLKPATPSNESKIKTVKFSVSGMTCEAGCAKRIEGTLYKQKGVKSSEVSFDKNVATIIYDETKISKEELVKIIEQCSRDNESIQPYKAVEIAN